MCGMYKNNNASNRARKENNATLDEDSDTRSNLLDIWRVNPAYSNWNYCIFYRWFYVRKTVKRVS